MHMCACMQSYACVHVHVRARVFMCEFVDMHLFVHVSRCVRAYAHACVRRACVRASVHACLHARMHVHVCATVHVIYKCL